MAYSEHKRVPVDGSVQYNYWSKRLYVSRLVTIIAEAPSDDLRRPSSPRFARETCRGLHRPTYNSCNQFYHFHLISRLAYSTNDRSISH